MKKIAITGLLLLSTLLGFSQKNEITTKKKTRFGITTGVNFNYYKVTIGNNRLSNLDPTSLFGGLLVETQLTDRFSLQGELLYSRVQSEELNFIEAPVFVKYRLGRNFKLYAGAQLNYLLEGNEPLDYHSGIQERLSAGFLVGAEYDFGDHWTLFARYSHRLTHNFHPNLSNIHGLKFGVAYKF